MRYNFGEKLPFVCKKNLLFDEEFIVHKKISLYGGNQFIKGWVVLKKEGVGQKSIYV